MSIQSFLLFLLISWTVYLVIRNFLVFGFVIRLNDLCFERVCEHIDNATDLDEEWFAEHDDMRKMWDEIVDNTPYMDMLFSFKPLEPEYWLNDEQLEFLGL